MRRPMRLAGLVLALLTTFLSVAVIPAASADASPAATAAPMGKYTVVLTLMNRYSGKCIDDPGQSTTPGLPLQQYDCNGTVAQQWAVRHESDGYYIFTNIQNGECLTDEGGWTGEGVPLVQAYCDGSTSQEWDFMPVSGLSQTYYLASVANGWRDVSVPNWGTSNGDPLQLLSCGCGAYQQWIASSFLLT